MLKSFWPVLMMGILMCACSENLTKRLNSSECRIEYTFENPSLGPVHGHQDLVAIVKNGELERLLSRQTGQPVSSSMGRPGWKVFRDIIAGKLSHYLIHYDNNHDPILIQPVSDTGIGGSYRIDVHYFECHDYKK